MHFALLYTILRYEAKLIVDLIAHEKLEISQDGSKAPSSDSNKENIDEPQMSVKAGAELHTPSPKKEEGKSGYLRYRPRDMIKRSGTYKGRYLRDLVPPPPPNKDHFEEKECVVVISPMKSKSVVPFTISSSKPRKSKKCAANSGQRSQLTFTEAKKVEKEESGLKDAIQEMLQTKEMKKKVRLLTCVDSNTTGFKLKPYPFIVKKQF